jgi:hypothetical protein
MYPQLDVHIVSKAKDPLLTLLPPSTSHTVCCVAAEGLVLLATLGVTEDAHTKVYLKLPYY